MRYKQARKLYNRRQKQALNLSKQAGDNLDKHVLGRFGRLLAVRRFVFSWLMFWGLLAIIVGWQIANLSVYFQTVEPVPGGIYNEGIYGNLTNVNPIYATSEVDSSLSRLIFAGLLTYNNRNQLVDCLASNYSVDSSGKTYIVHLKPGLTWQDGKPLTAADVVFTFDTIKNVNAQSPLYSSWQGVNISAVNSLTVKFSLPNPLASFPYNLTTGIIPKHILGSISPSELRSANFNTVDPVGSGPFKWHAIEVNGDTPQNAIEQIGLLPFSGYVLGKPRLAEFIVHAYASKAQLIDAFNSGQLNGLAGLGSVPKSLVRNSVHIYSPLLTAGDYVFFKTNTAPLNDVAVRRALVLASNPQSIISRLKYNTIPVNEPLLIGQLAYNVKYAQLANDPTQAKQILSQDGWQISKNGFEYKNGQMLQFNLVTTNTSENHLVVSMLQSQWRAIGANLQPIYESANTYSTTIQDHNYNMTLNAISIGIDPDVFVYWDSSQYDPRSTDLNFSDYNNTNADIALEAGRTRLNPALRVIKYRSFLADWQKDAPALGLYQPRALYITRQTVYGLNVHEMNTPEGRYNNVQNWEILTANVTDPHT